MIYEQLSLNDESIIAAYAGRVQQYEFTVAYWLGMCLLDARCCAGYGSNCLAANRARAVLAVDISGEVLNEASLKYRVDIFRNECRTSDKGLRMAAGCGRRGRGNCSNRSSRVIQPDGQARSGDHTCGRKEGHGTTTVHGGAVLASLRSCDSAVGGGNFSIAADGPHRGLQKQVMRGMGKTCV